MFAIARACQSGVYHRFWTLELSRRRTLSSFLLVDRLVDEIDNSAARISDLVQASKEYSLHGPPR